jgi:hypothetical protein
LRLASGALDRKLLDEVNAWLTDSAKLR